MSTVSWLCWMVWKGPSKSPQQWRWMRALMVMQAHETIRMLLQCSWCCILAELIHKGGRVM